MKYCKTCEKTKHVSEFNKSSKSPDGLQHRCRQCARDSNKARYQAQGEKIRKQVAERATNLGGNAVLYEQRRDYYKKRYQDNREEILARQAAYSKANPEVRAGIKGRRRAVTAKLTKLDRKKSLIWRRKIKDNLCYYCPPLDVRQGGQ